MDTLYHLIVKGRVQGVFFRDYTQRKAVSLGLKGTVRNRADGAVEIFAIGEEVQLKALEQWCWEGSPSSEVVNVQLEVSKLSTNYPDFRVIY